MKYEYKMESLNTCISELQQQTNAQRLELEDAHFGYAESRREQVRLQEELVMKGRALRDESSEIASDEFPAQKLRESHGTMQKLTS